MNNETAPANKARTFLIVCFRLLGDVLVSTPLAYSIKQSIPDATIDYLVFQGTDKALAKNPLIRRVISVPRRESNARVLISLWKRYDVALAAYPSDRTIISAAIAGRMSIGFLCDYTSNLWRRAVLSRCAIYDDSVHVVWNMLSLLAPLGIVPLPRGIMGYDEEDRVFARTGIAHTRYVLVHPYSMMQYKYWSAQHWGKLAGLLQNHTGCKVIFTETPAHEDRVYLNEILSYAPAATTSFACDLNQLAAALEGCKAYISVDTGTTHIAAALNIPVFALYGSSWTRYWAPWPNDVLEKSPFAANKGIQTVSNVTVIQKDWECVPCNKEVCRISTRGRIECMEAITPEEVANEVIKHLREQ
jgi:heptosyltransferase-3